MAKPKMSAAARKRMSEAQKRRWAAYRKKKGRRGSPTVANRRARRPWKPGDNPYLPMTIEALVNEKRQFDEAWEVAKGLIRGSN